MEHALHLLLLLVVTRLLGEIFERVRQPASIGEIFAGVLLALVAASPDAYPFLANLPSSPFLQGAADYGIFFLLLFAGVELNPRELSSRSTASLTVALGGVLFPLASGFLLAWEFLPNSSFKLAQSLVVGVALSISAIPVSVKVLHERGILHGAVGTTIVSAALIDDIIGMFLLAVVLSLITTGGQPPVLEFLLLLGNVVAFFAATALFGIHITPRIMRTVQRFRIPAPEISALLAIAFGFAFLAEALGLDFILGPFMAGLFFDRHAAGATAYDKVKAHVQAATDGLLAPLFFASIGARIDLAAMSAIPLFLLALITIAILGKLLGAGIPARITGLSTRESIAVGIGMSGRGAVELIIASIALEAGVFGYPADPIVSNLFSALVITAVATTLVMPIGLRFALRP